MAEEVDKAEEVENEEHSEVTETSDSGGSDQDTDEGSEQGGQEGDGGTEEAPLDEATWGSTGDEVGDSVLQVMQNSGLKPEEAKALVYDAVRDGDPSKIDRDALVEKVGKAKATLILAGIENYTIKQQQRVQEIVSSLHEAAQGKDNWDKVAAWAKKNLPEKDIAGYADMIDAGGVKARSAANDLVRLYNADPNNTSIGKEVRAGGRVSEEPEKGLTRREYFEQKEKLHREGKLTDEAKQRLWRQREAGKKKGI